MIYFFDFDYYIEMLAAVPVEGNVDEYIETIWKEFLTEMSGDTLEEFKKLNIIDICIHDNGRCCVNFTLSSDKDQIINVEGALQPDGYAFFADNGDIIVIIREEEEEGDVDTDYLIEARENGNSLKTMPTA